MFIYYKNFGLVANLALIANILIITATLSLFQATLTLSGIAGIVLTVGMAVDANVLIYERIREELFNGNSPNASIISGRDSMILGMILVILFMFIYYKNFGLVANLALIANILIITATLSLFQATLTLSGIAGIVLTVGMAVDANVLIYERIREELFNGNSPNASIVSGYNKAFSTISDANITTLIAAIALLTIGTGVVKGFAVTLVIGILSSMFTAIIGTRAIISIIYENKTNKGLSI